MPIDPLDRLSLRALMRTLPEDELNTFQGLIQQPDRVTAIVASTYVEDALRQAIIERLDDDLGEPDLDEVFDDAHDGPLVRFSSRTIMARALGIIGPRTRRDLDRIRRIRNNFAHSAHPVSFQTQAIKNLCADIALLNAGTKVPPSFPLDPTQGTKEKFVAVCWELTLLLPLTPTGFIPEETVAELRAEILK